MKILRTSSRFSSSATLLGTCASLAAFSSPATGAIIETATIENYAFIQTNYEDNSPAIEWDFGSDTRSFQQSYYSQSGGYSYVNVGLTATLQSNGSFYFLHNATCVGSCYIDMYTVVTFTLYNDGNFDENIAFNSLITPGHLARQNYRPGDGEGTFNFQVFEDETYVNSVDDALFYALGDATPNRGKIANGDYQTTDPTYNTKNESTFAAQNRQKTDEGDVFGTPAAPPSYNVLDWSATGLGVDVPTIRAGETRTVRYFLSTFVAQSNVCTVASECSGLQVAFGDPRSTGSINNSRTFDFDMMGDTDGELSLNDPAYNPVVGAAYDPYLVTVALVPQGTPAVNPSPEGPISYGGTFTVPAVGPGVPEPSTWAMLLLGFGVLGAAMRRRQVSLGLV